MTRQLVFVHGRAQQHRDPGEVKAEWLGALKEGLRETGLHLPLGESDARVAYYGDTLDQLVSGVPPQDVARVAIRGEDADAGWQQFCSAVAQQAQARFAISDEEAATFAGPQVSERGIANWRWTLGILRAVDRRVPGASAAGIALAFRDVYLYLTNTAVRTEIDDGVREALAPGAEAVVVGHSLGSVVAYSLLRREGAAHGWQVPLLMTVGSPLAVTAVRDVTRAEAVTRCPPCADRWLNALDERDPVALYPLTPQHFPLTPPEPAIGNYTSVVNQTPSRHGISGYLSNPWVARNIYEALSG